MNPLKRQIWPAAAFLIPLVWAFAAYSWVRTRSGPIGPDPVRMALTFVRSLTLFAPPWLMIPSAWIVIGVWSTQRLLPRSPAADKRVLIVAAATAWILSCACAEAVLAADEIAFAREALARPRPEGYRRDRRWSLQYGELVWTEGRAWCVDH